MSISYFYRCADGPGSFHKPFPLAQLDGGSICTYDLACESQEAFAELQRDFPANQWDYLGRGTVYAIDGVVQFEDDEAFRRRMLMHVRRRGVGR